MKAAMYINAQIFINSLIMLGAKLLYRRSHDAGKDIDPTQLLFM
jgi:hypothetical protein